MRWDEQWRAALDVATGQFAGLLASGDLTAAVPACPGWTLHDLAGHLGGIHRWATHAVRHGTPGGEPAAVPPGRIPLQQWYLDSAAELIDVLEQTPPDAPAWSFGPRPRTAGFWRRRQVHETQMHLYDALASQGRTYRFDDTVARDGIEEVTSIFFPRQVRLERTPPVPGTLQLDAGDGSGWAICGDGASPPGPARATVSGPASALLLLLWKRIGPDDARLQVSGDPRWAASVLSQALTP